MLEFLMLYLIDCVETQRERKPQTLPFKTTGTAYKLVNPRLGRRFRWFQAPNG